MEKKFIGIIPARYASTRFPGKPLAKIGGITMIERVYRQAQKALDTVIVATDDSRIYDTVVSFGGDVVMTSSNLRSGTDRCFEAFHNCDVEADVVINIQGDEPFIDPSQIEALKKCFDDDSVDIATLIRPFNPDNDFSELKNPNTPKVVVDNQWNALYFSRSVIPFVRNADLEAWPACVQFYTHVGIYAFRSKCLAEVVALPSSSLELAESLEQLRWLQNGYKIRTAVTNSINFGIDTPADLEAAEEYLKRSVK